MGVARGGSPGADLGKGQAVLPALTRVRGRRPKPRELRKGIGPILRGSGQGEGKQAEPERDTDRVGQGEGVRLGQLQAREPARLGSLLPVWGHPSASGCSDCSRPSRPVHCRHQRRRHLTLASGSHHRRLGSLRLRLRRHAFRPGLRRCAGGDGARTVARALGSQPSRWPHEGRGLRPTEAGRGACALRRSRAVFLASESWLVSWCPKHV